MKKVLAVTKIRFVMMIVSLLVIALLWGGTVFIRGKFNLGIDFVGGLNMQIQLAPVVFDVTYTGDGIVEARILGGTMSLEVKEFDGDETYTFTLRNYTSVSELTEDIARIESMSVNLRQYGERSPEAIISKDDVITLRPGNGMLVHMPVADEEDIFAPIEEIRTVFSSLGDISIQYIGDRIRQEYMLKVRVEDVLSREEIERLTGRGVESGEGQEAPAGQEAGEEDVSEMTGESGDESGGLEDTVTEEAVDQEAAILAAQAEEPDILDRIQERITGLLDASFNRENILITRTDFVGPSFSRELLLGALGSVLLAIVLILIYITIRFKIGFAIGAVSALIHDVMIMLGFIGLAQLEVTSATLAAVLTIIGYSLNDTIVVFDRIRENSTLLRELDRGSIINTSISQSLSRTVITSLTTLLAVSAIFIFGTGVIRDLALNLIIGIIVGTYSSIFIASPILLGWQNMRDRKKKEKMDGGKKKTVTTRTPPPQQKADETIDSEEETEDTADRQQPSGTKKKKKKKKKKK